MVLQRGACRGAKTDKMGSDTGRMAQTSIGGRCSHVTSRSRTTKIAAGNPGQIHLRLTRIFKEGLGLDVFPTRGARARHCERRHPDVRTPGETVMGKIRHARRRVPENGSIAASHQVTRYGHIRRCILCHGPKSPREEKEPGIRRGTKKSRKLRMERHADAAT